MDNQDHRDLLELLDHQDQLDLQDLLDHLELVNQGQDCQDRPVHLAPQANLDHLVHQGSDLQVLLDLQELEVLMAPQDRPGPKACQVSEDQQDSVGPVEHQAQLVHQDL